MEDEDEQDDNQVGFEILLEGDEGFNDCRVGEWNRNDEEEEEQTFFMGSSLDESFQDQGLYEQGTRLGSVWIAILGEYVILFSV